MDTAADTLTLAQPKPASRRRLILGGVLLAALALGGISLRDYWTTGRFMVETDDAYLKADIPAVAPKVQGYVRALRVAENQAVTAGEVLVQLDDGDYQNALKVAQNQVATQEVTITRIAAQARAAEAVAAQAQAQELAAEATSHNAQTKAGRVQALAKSSTAAQASVDDALAALDQARAAVTGATASIAAAEANVAVLKAQGAEAQSTLATLQLAVEQAQRNLDRTTLRAPVDGMVANIAVEAGDLVSPGQRLAAVVPTGEIHVEANFKETQLEGIAPGARAEVTIDAMPGKVFEGTVSSIAPATGAEFSLLPAQNATGNFTKVVQRVPVRISLPAEALSSGLLRSGLSAVVKIDSRTGSVTAGN